jgi:hypothetical protein
MNKFFNGMNRKENKAKKKIGKKKKKRNRNRKKEAKWADPNATPGCAARASAPQRAVYRIWMNSYHKPSPPPPQTTIETNEATPLPAAGQLPYQWQHGR